METPRIRINAKQTSKGRWYFEATAETDDAEVSADKLLIAIKAIEQRFLADGRELVEVT